jgi:hypothetical protein
MSYPEFIECLQSVHHGILSTLTSEWKSTGTSAYPRELEFPLDAHNVPVGSGARVGIAWGRWEAGHDPPLPRERDAISDYRRKG